MSHFWQEICKFWDSFQCSPSVIVGNGKLCDFWKDKWCSDVSLANLFPRSFDLAENNHIVVSQAGFVVSNGWHWKQKFRRNLIGSQIDEYRELLLMIGDYSVSNQKDERIWRWESKGKFTVKSYYAFLINRRINFAHKHIWLVSVLLKVRILMWIILKGRLNTLDLLAHEGIGHGGYCIMCGGGTETFETSDVGMFLQ